MHFLREAAHQPERLPALSIISMVAFEVSGGIPVAGKVDRG